MTDPAFQIRPGTAQDSRPAFDVFLPAIKDLAIRLGSPWEVEPEDLWTRLGPMYEFLAAHAAEWWVAEDAATGQLIGHARSIERGGLFELSEFFVLPGRQMAGVGAALLKSTFPEGRGEVRAIIATSDVRAQARYYRAGTAARFPILSLNGAPGAAAGDGAADRTMEAQRATEEDIPALVELEHSVLGFDRGDEFRWLLEHREGYLYRRSGRIVGSGFLGSRGGVGPVSAAQPADTPGILDHLERRAAELEIAEMSFDTPGPNEAGIRHLLDRGFRLDQFLTLLMSNRPFGQFDRFIGFSPPFVL
ncbi:MAG TPA: GNAT family N-acetyltransferase [Candidatus Limnocylindrales bacterium]|nr:GNAT family N-acetyltransferase [Candidatus Limnocylindrales bacterium]